MNEKEYRIAIPSKGRLKDKSIELLKRTGLKFRLSGRQLFARCAETGIMVIFSHAQDIPALVEEGVVDLGITGSDLVIEKNTDVVKLLELGFGKCRLSFAAHADSKFKKIEDFNNSIIGTKFVNLAKKYFKENNILNVHIIEINGAVEVMVLLGIVDGILDVVETGSSLREHDLVELESILTAQAVLIGNNETSQSDTTQRLKRRLEGVLLAKQYSMLEYNCLKKDIEKAKSITPGYSSPTIQKTDSEEWFAVRVMVKKEEVQSVMDQLELLGVQAIIETEVNHCRL